VSWISAETQHYRLWTGLLNAVALASLFIESEGKKKNLPIEEG
jgi:hypothetical protein